MRVSTQLTLVLTTAGLALFSAHGAHQLRKEQADLRAAFLAETRLLARSLQVALTNALRDRQVEDIQETLDALEAIDPGVDVFVFDSQGVLRAESSTGKPEAILRAPRLASGAAAQQVHWDEASDERRLMLSLPLGPGGGTGAMLVVVRPLDRLQADLADTRRAIIRTVIAFGVVTAGLGLLLGSAYIRRPLARLAMAMRELRCAGTTSELPIVRHDEIGGVVAEFNALVAELRQAESALAREAEARLELERGLRRVDKLVTLGQLSAGLAHEIGSPLQVLNGRARALLAQAHDPERVEKTAAILVQQTERIGRVVEQLLQYARRQPARTGRIDLVATAGIVIELLEIEARRRGVALVLESSPGRIEIVADAGQVQQIVLNLVSNALVATPGGGSVRVSLGHCTLEPAGSSPVLAARISVADSGCGMSEAVRERLFEPFFTTRLHKGGTGLGLAVVKSIVDEHAGAIGVVSQAGRGSTFVVDLPIDGIDGPAGARALAS